MNGILLVDKPRGITSHHVISMVRKAIQFKKIGHVGTLDPEATGLLVLCLGKATKISSFLMNSDKSYYVKFRLGIETDSYDMAGKVLRQVDASAIRQADVETELQSFLGTQMQKPPMFSAVKLNGKKLYEYARAEEEIDVPEREVEIQSIQLLAFGDAEGVMEVSCSKGTYIRSLVHDLGRAVEVGATCTEIRRTRSGKFTISNAVSLSQIVDADSPRDVVADRMIPISSGLSDIPQIEIAPPLVCRISNGIGIHPDDYSFCRWNQIPKGPVFPVLMIQENGEALALAEYDGKASLRVQRVF